MSTSSKVSELYGQAYEYTDTPYPAWLLSGSLLASGVSRVLNAQPPNSKYVRKPVPTATSGLLFGSAFALGGFMIYDGDVDNGSGFNFAWSTLYLIVNGKRSLFSFRPVPTLISGMALTNAAIYGARFFTKNRGVEKIKKQLE